MTTDGSLIFDTKMDTDGFTKGTKQISSKVVELKNKISATESEIANLRQELDQMADTPMKSNVTEKLEKDIAKAKSHLKSLYAEADRIGNAKQSDLTSMGFDTEYLDDMLAQDKGWQKVQKQIDETEAKLQEYERELKQVKASESKVTGKDTAEYAKKKQKLDALSGQLNVYKAKLRETQAKESSSSKTVKSSVDALNAMSKKLKEVYNRLKKAFTKTIVDRIKKLGNNTARTNKQMGLLSKSIARIKQALAGLLLYQVLQGVIDSIKEGINSLAKASPQANKNLSALLTSLEYLRNSLATVFAPILNVVTPILTGFIDTLSVTTDKIAQFIATLTGQDTYTKAIKVQKDYAESLDDTTKATEDNTEANEKNLAGYDQLNVMQSTATEKNSADSKGEETAFTTVPLKINSFAEQLKEAIKKSDFEGIGQLVADKLNKSMKNVKWNKIRNTAKKWAKNIASTLNGFIKKLDWGLVGNTIAEGLNSGITAIHTFLSTIDWKEFGKSITDSFNSFVNDFEWGTFGSLLADKFNIPIDILTGFAYTFDWNKFGEQITNSLKSFIGTLHLEDAGNTLGLLLEGLSITAQEFFTSPSWSTLGDKISTAISNFFSHDPFGSIVSIIQSALEALFNTAISLFDPENLNTSLMGEDVAEAINDFFGDEKWWETAGKSLNNTALGITDFLCTAIGDIEVNKITDAIAKLLSEIDWLYLGLKMGELLFKAIAQGIAFVHSIVLKIPILGDLMGAITGVTKENFEEWLDSNMSDYTIFKDEVSGNYYKGSGIGINKMSKEEWEELKEKIDKYGPEAGQVYAQNGIDGLNEWIEQHNESFDKMKDTLSKSEGAWGEYGEEVIFTVDNIDYTLKDLVSLSEDEFTKLSKHFNTDDWKQWGNGIKTVEDVFKKATGSITDSFIKTESGIRVKAKSGKKDIEDYTVHIARKGEKSADDLEKGYTASFDNIASACSQMWKTIKGVFADGGGIDKIKNAIWNVFKSALNGLIDGINSLINKPFDILNDAFSSVRDFEFMGIKVFDWLPTITAPQIPKLATGTVVPANYGEFLAVLGDNKREAEIVSPISAMKQAVKEAILEGGFSGNTGDIHITLTLPDGSVLFRTVVDENNRYKKSHGHSAL